MIYPFEHIRIKHNPLFPVTEELIRKRRRGDVLHAALSYITTLKETENIPIYVKRALIKLRENPDTWDIERDFIEPLNGVFKLEGIETFFPETLKDGVRVLRERDFLSGTRALRPDRVVLFHRYAVVVDFKVHLPEADEINSYMAQVRQYMSLVRGAYGVPVKGYLLFIEPAIIEKVGEVA
jgi:hypothetical protein